jgi:protein TonB
VSFALHASIVMVLVVSLHRALRDEMTISPRSESSAQLVFLDTPGPGGGGGGGGNRMPEPPRRADRPGHDATTVPAVQPARSSPRAPEPDPLGGIVVPLATLASSVDSLPGSIEAPPGPPTASLGPGNGGGSGTDAGSGDGPGRGSGLGPGQDRGTGRDVYQPGNGVTMPVELQKGRPEYTTDAMRARVQGSILVSCIVRTDGVCGDIRVLRSMNPPFGLDEQAIKAASAWRFRPGTRQGVPVAVRVTMEIAFVLR